jgi:glycerol dehydrogenase
MTYSFESPAAYVQGRGVTNEIGERIDSLGDTALVIGDDVVLGIVEERVRNSLDAAGIEVVVAEFGGECSTTEIERVGEVATDVGADVIIGAGGGKTLDTAKAVSERLDIAMVSMPTIASTDAPTSSLSVVYTEEGEFEEYWFHESHPDLVLVDTDVIAGAPTRFFRSGIADAMATWFEGEAVHRAAGENFFGEQPTNAAYRLCSLCYELLRDHGDSAIEAVERDAVTEAVEAVTEANTLLSGLGFESGGIAAAHSVHNGLTRLEDTHDATHGEKVNVGTVTQLVLEGRPDGFIEDVIDFSVDLGLPVTLAELGVAAPSKQDLERVAEAALASEETIHNAFDVSVAEVRDAMIVADELGRARLGTK